MKKKPKYTRENPGPLRKPQLRILRALTSQELADAASVHVTMIGINCGKIDPAIRKKAEDDTGIISLHSRGLVEISENAPGGAKAVYRLTIMGHQVAAQLDGQVPLTAADGMKQSEPSGYQEEQNVQMQSSRVKRTTTTKTPGSFKDEANDDQPRRTSGLETSEPSLRSQSPATPGWVEHLLASPVFEDQKQMGGRSLPADELLTRLLSLLDQHGGKMTRAALARELQYPPVRLPGLLAKTQRILNVDGYDVLRRDEASDTVELDRELLFRQFGLIR